MYLPFVYVRDVININPNYHKRFSHCLSSAIIFEFFSGKCLK